MSTKIKGIMLSATLLFGVCMLLLIQTVLETEK